MEAAEGPDSGDRDRNRCRHPGKNPAVEQDSPAGDLANVDQLTGVLVLSSTPTEPQVTDVTSASTARVLVGQHHRFRARVLGQPALGLVVEVNQEAHALTRLLS
jgi:hypothetical protein